MSQFHKRTLKISKQGYDERLRSTVLVQKDMEYQGISRLPERISSKRRRGRVVGAGEICFILNRKLQDLRLEDKQGKPL